MPHLADWTYSLAVPPDHEWHALPAVESYERMHRWLQRAFAIRGVSTRVADCCEPSGPGQCFIGWEKFDLLQAGRKIAGAAHGPPHPGKHPAGARGRGPGGVRGSDAGRGDVRLGRVVAGDATGALDGDGRGVGEVEA